MPKFSLKSDKFSTYKVLKTANKRAFATILFIFNLRKAKKYLDKWKKLLHYRYNIQKTVVRDFWLDLKQNSISFLSINEG